MRRMKASEAVGKRVRVMKFKSEVEEAVFSRYLGREGIVVGIDVSPYPVEVKFHRRKDTFLFAWGELELVEEGQ